MRNAPRSLRRSRPLVPVLAFAALASAAATAACSSDGESEGGKSGRSDWTCERADVPMGEVTRCTKTVAAADSAAGGDLGLRTYATPGEGSSSEEPAPPEPEASPSPEPEDEWSSYECSPGEASADCPGDVPAAPPGDTSNPPGPDECSFTPELPYCTEAPPAPPPPPSGGMHCSKDGKGNKVCETTPSCAPGTHPSTCGACVPDGEPDDCVSPANGGCWVTGGGFIVEPSLVPVATAADGHDNYGGNAKQMKDGRIQGHWNHVDHGTMHHAKGRPEYIFCRHVDEPGPGQPGGKKGFDMNQIYFGGHAEWRTNGAWQGGYWFDVVAKDHGEPGSKPSPKNGGMVDEYHFTIRKMDDPQAKVSGPVVYEVKGGLVGGNIQIHPPNNGHPGFQSPLPAWVALEP